MSELIQAVLMKVSNIANSPTQLRKVNKNGEGFLGIVENMRSNGYDSAFPIKVRKTPADWKDEQEYMLVDGGNRLAAAREAGLEEIAVIVVEMDEFQAMVSQIVSNAHNVETKPIEYAEQILRLMSANPLLTMAEIGKMLSKSDSWISRVLAINTLADDVKKLVNTGKVPLVNAFLLTRLVDKADVVNYIESSMTMNVEDFTTAINQRNAVVKKARQEGRAIGGIVEFVPTPRLRKGAELKGLLEDNSPILPLIQDITNPVDIANMVIKYILHLDPVTVAADKEAFDAQQSQKKAAADARAKAALLKKEEAAKKINDELIAARAAQGETAVAEDAPVL